LNRIFFHFHFTFRIQTFFVQFVPDLLGVAWSNLILWNYETEKVKLSLSLPQSFFILSLSLSISLNSSHTCTLFLSVFLFKTQNFFHSLIEFFSLSLLFYLKFKYSFFNRILFYISPFLSFLTLTLTLFFLSLVLCFYLKFKIVIHYSFLSLLSWIISFSKYVFDIIFI